MPADTAMIIYTSGTTGPPKGAMLSHRNILFMAGALMAPNPPFAEDEGVSYLPLPHLYQNLVPPLLPPPAAPAVGFLAEPAEPLPHPPRAGPPLPHGRAPLCVLAPLRPLLGLARVRLGLCGAAPASPDLFEYFHALGVPLLEGYGQTESSGVIATNRMSRTRIGTVGEPLPG